MPSATQKLKPCPFCGGEAEMIVTMHQEVVLRHEGCSFLDRIPWTGFSAESLVSAWNRRAPTKAKRK